MYVFVALLVCWETLSNKHLGHLVLRYFTPVNETKVCFPNFCNIVLHLLKSHFVTEIKGFLIFPTSILEYSILSCGGIYNW